MRRFLILRRGSFWGEGVLWTRGVGVTFYVHGRQPVSCVVAALAFFQREGGVLHGCTIEYLDAEEVRREPQQGELLGRVGT